MNKIKDSKEKQKIFVSYAHADNQPFGINNTKWVSKLVDDIRKALKMETKDPVIVTDHMFNKSGLLDNRIKEAVEQSSLFIAIVSKAYIKSSFCTRERKIFEDKYKSEYDSRIIIVEKDEVADGNPFESHLRNIFWYTDSESQRSRTLCLMTNTQAEVEEYYMKINELKISISEELTDRIGLQVYA